jgi:hypothetical protein
MENRKKAGHGRSSQATDPNPGRPKHEALIRKATASCSNQIHPQKVWFLNGRKHTDFHLQNSPASILEDYLVFRHNCRLSLAHVLVQGPN